ncbi:1-(5-phosphoribosyl)-5-((5-phosphoribosylamino)methylideneamino)imidazole-4-carboxamide isomerase [Archaeoglobales archaeon]|nr:MAG: 1-(5-phosphoribosyl)-5-((5-phosphoribosylamino)methylideneamino)imidazole-4-carboxamide isomerase [Archaeoglobales archaeon]
MGFLVIPAIDLKDGKVTRLIQGDFNRITIQLDNPIDVAAKWVKDGAKCLHVIDLDGAYHGELRHHDIILKIRKACDVELQVGGGLRGMAEIEKLIKDGINRVILGTVVIEKPDLVRELAESYPKRIMIAIDSRGGKVAIDGWRKQSDLTPLEIMSEFDDYEVSFLYTNIDVEGLVSGMDYARIEEIINSTSRNVYVAGGISSLEDIEFARKCGAAGVIIGSALYTGKIDFKQAVKLQVV